MYTNGFFDPVEFTWANDQLDFNATWNMLLVISEESKKFDIGLKNAYQAIPCQQIAGMRNYLAYDYRGVDKDLIFQTSRDSLVILKDVLIDMIGNVDYENGALVEALNSPYYRHIQYLRSKLHD
ncbi:hypothetical protein GCM10027577_42670 [Spirosoma fluminis]